MSFGLPLALLALGLLAGPLVAHVVRRRETKSRPLPTFALLRKAVAENEKKRRLTDPWLLALRLALAALAVCAAAIPLLRVSVESGDGRAAALAVVLDASRSMAARDGSVPRFEVARDRAIDALEALPQGSEVTVVVATTPPRVLVDRGYDVTEAVRALAALEPSVLVGGDTLDAAVRSATRRLHGTRLEAKRLVVYSDFAAHVSLRLDALPEGVTAEAVQVARESLPNGTIEVRGVDRVEGEPDARAVSVRVRTLGARHAATVELEVDGRTADTIRVPPSEVPSTVVLTARGVRADATASVSLEVDDALPEDDEAAFALAAGGQLRVLLVDGEPSVDRWDDEVAMLARALELGGGERPRFAVERVMHASLDARAFDRADVVVLANVPGLAADAAAALVRRVGEGVGLLVAPGDRTDGRSLDVSLRDILPARVGHFGACTGRDGLRARARGAASLPIGVEAVRRTRCTELDPALGRSEVLYTAADGTPMVVAGMRTRGVVVVLATALDAEDSDLPLRSGFPAFASTLLERAAGRVDRVPQVLTIGSTLPSPEAATQVLTPSAKRLAPRDGVLGPFLELGAHTWTTAAGRAQAFTVVADVAESDLTLGTVPTVTGPTARRAGRSTLERDLSAPFFLVVGMLLVFEAFYRESSRMGRRPTTTRRTLP